MKKTDLLVLIVDELKRLAIEGVLPSYVSAMTITEQTRLDDLGIDSLGRMLLLSSLMNLTDQYLPDEALQHAETIENVLSAALSGMSHTAAG